MDIIPATNNSSAIQVIGLEYLWWGVCIGGRHYTGYLKFYDEKGFNQIEVERKLSLKESKQYAEEQNMLWHKKLSRITNKFETRDSLEYHSLQWCEKNLKGDWLLLNGDMHNPSRAIGGKGWITERIPLINKITEIWDAIPESKRTDEIYNETYNLWKSILEPTWKTQTKITKK